MKNKTNRKTNKTTAKGIWKLHSDGEGTPIKFEEQKKYISADRTILFRPKTEEVEKFIKDVYNVEEMEKPIDYSFEHEADKGYVGTLIDIGYVKEVIELFEFIEADEFIIWTGNNRPMFIESEGLEVIVAQRGISGATHLLENSVFLRDNKQESG